MLRTMACRVIASLVAFLCGCGVSMIRRPTESLTAPGAHFIEISAITLKKQGCTDPELKCAVFDVTFRSDGTATFIGYANDEYIGKYTASYSRRDFAYLADQVRREQFFELPWMIPANQVEETIVLQIVTNEGSPMVSAYSWASTPPPLRTLVAVVDYQIYQVEWEKVEH